MADDINDRIAVAAGMASLTAIVSNLKESMGSILGEVRAGNQQSSQQNTDIQKSIAVLSNEQKNYAKYQDECDTERKEMKADIITLKTKAGLIGAACGIISASGIEIALAMLHKS